MADWIFAFVHLGLIIAIVIYAFLSLLQGNLSRFLLIMVCLTAYYFLVLHKAVRKEIARRRAGSSQKPH